MKKRLVAVALFSAASAASTSAFGSVVYDQFDYPTGTSLSTASGGTWTATSSGTGEVSVVANNLQYTDANPAYGTTIGTPTGNAANIPNAAAKSDRIGLNGLPSGSGTLFYSMLIDVTNLTGLTTSGAFIAGFNNSTGTATSSITQAGARLQVRRDLNDSTKYNLGIRNDVSASTGTSTISWDTTPFAAGSTVFVVGEYEFNQSSSTDDVARLWINPDPSTLGADTAPATTLTSTGGDINQLQIQSFALRALSGGGTTTVDELRIDNSWQNVTSVPEPASLGVLAAGGALGLLARRRKRS
jgi:hypothetical protein